MQTNLSRRAMLGGTAAACVASGVASAPSPDAELFAAWREYVEVVTHYDSLPTTMTDAEIAPLTARLDRCRDRMETLPAKTLDGMHLKFRYLLTSMTEHPSADEVLVHGRPATEAFLKRVNSDFREAMVWRMVQDTAPVVMAA